MRLERRATEKHFLHCQNSRKVFPIMDKILVCTVIAERLNTVPSKMVNIHVLFLKGIQDSNLFREKKSISLLEIGFSLRFVANTVLRTYYGCFQPFLYLLVQSNTQITFAYLSFFQLCRIRLEAMSGDRVELKCSLYNVHHEIDMDRFSVEWIASKYQQSSKKSGSTTSSGTCCTPNTDCHEFVQFSESNVFDRPS